MDFTSSRNQGDKPQGQQPQADQKTQKTQQSGSRNILEAVSGCVGPRPETENKKAVEELAAAQGKSSMEARQISEALKNATGKDFFAQEDVQEKK